MDEKVAAKSKSKPSTNKHNHANDRDTGEDTSQSGGEIDQSPIPRSNKKAKQRREPSPIPEPRSSKRLRAQYQPFQSPTLHIPHSRAKPVEEKIIVFYKSEFLALRNESGSFFICQAAQNVYKSSRRFKIRWLSKVDSRESDVYSRDFYDFTDFECVLTNLRMDRLDKNLFRLPKSEHSRTENILRRALNLENGIREAEPEQIEKDGVDVSKLSDAERKDDKENETSPSCSTRKSTTDSSGESSKSPVARSSWKGEGNEDDAPKIRSTRSATLKIVRSGNLKATISLRSKGKTDSGYRIKRNNGRGDDEVEEDDDDTSGHFKRKVSRVQGRRHESPSTHIGRLNPNASVTVFPKDPMFESNTSIPFISVSAHSKLLIRAVLMNDIMSLQKLLSDTAHPCSIGVIRSVDQKYDALAYALIRENSKAIQILMKEWQKCEPSTLKSPETLLLHHGVGRYNFRTLGVEVREMSLSRGAREGNSALMKDCHQLLTEQDYINLMLQHGVSKSTLDLFCNLISKSKHNVKEKVMTQLYLAVCAGHRQLAGQLVEDALASDGYGFNYLHKEVLLNDQQDLSPFRQTAVRKQPFTNCGITPLHCAAINPNPKYLKSLLDVEPDFNIADKRHRRVIHYAAACEGPAPLELLLSRGVKIDDVDIEGNTALHMASGAGRDHNVDLILRKAKADRRYGDDAKHIKDHGIGGINRPNRAGYTPLHLACMKGNLGVVKVLVKNGGNLERQTTISRNRVTALMLACQHGHAEVMRFLLQSGARLEARDKWKRTAMTHAVMNGHAHISSHLLRIGADASVTDSSGNTLLHYAVAYGWWFCVELLLDTGAKVNISNEWKVLPLGIAFLKGHIGIVDLLLEKTEVDVNFKDDNGLTIIMLAVCSPLTAQLVEHVRCLIVNKKANCVDADIHGNTALHWLACNRVRISDAEDSDVNAEVVQTSLELAHLLLDNGCDPSVRNHQGQTALKLAIEQGNNKLVQLLLRDSCQVTAEVDDTGENLLHDLVEHMCDADLSSLIQVIKESQTVKKHKKPSVVDDTIDTTLKNPRMPLLHSIEGSLKQGCAIHIQAMCNGTSEKFTMSLIQGKNLDKDDVALELSLRWPASNSDRKEAVIVCNRRVGGVWNKDPSEAPFSAEVGTHNQNRIELDVKLSEESYQVLVSGNMLAEFQTDVPYGQVTHLSVSGDVNLELIQIVKPLEMTKAILARLSAPSDVLREMAQTYSYDGFTPLLLACSQYQFAADKKQSARLRDMIKALIEDAESEVHAVVKKRSDNKTRYIDGYSALHFLSSGKDVPVVSENAGEIPVPGLQLLLSYKPPINVQDNKGRSPLICAILNGQQSAAEALINSGADVNLCSGDMEEDGKASPLILASKLGLMLVVKLLLKHRADVQVADAKHGNTALHYAVAMKTVAESVEIVHCLVEAGININATNFDGCTPLHLAVNSSTGRADYEVEIEEYLIERGANLLCQDKLGRIPLHFAFVKIGRRMDSSKVDPIEVVSLLTGAMKPGNIDQADCFGQTPLHCAAFRGATISCLHLARGMKNLNAKDKNGNTALGLAVLGSHDSCATMLIQQGACVQVEVVILPPNPAADLQTKRRPWQWLPVAQGVPQQQSVPILQEVIRRDWQGVMYMMLGQLLATGVDHFPAIEAALQTNKFNLALSLIARTKNIGKLNIKNNEEQNLLHILSCKANASCNLEMQVKVAQVLVKKGISVSAADKHGSTPLIYAAMNKNAALCEYFTAHLGVENVCMMKPDKYGRTPITAAFWNIEPCQWNNSKLLPFRNWCEKLSIHGCSVNVLVQYKFLDIFPGEVCVSTSLSSSRQHLDLSLPVDPQPPCRVSPLIFAICLREYNLVSFLLKHGADLNFPDLQGRTPLMHAVRKNDIGMVKLLLNPKYCYKGDLWYAVQKRNIGRKHLNHLYINTQKKAATKSETIEFPQVVQQPKARFVKDIEKNVCSKVLTEEDVDVSGEIEEKELDAPEDLSPKAVPASQNSPKVTENDLGERMDGDMDDMGTSSFIQTDEISCLKLQGAPGPIEKTSDVDLAQTDKQGWTVIHHLVRPFACGGYDNLEMLITLAEVGAPLAIPNSAGLTPLHLAVFGRSTKLANMLGKLTEVPGVNMIPIAVDDVKIEDGLHWDTRVCDFNADARLVLERAENEAMEEGEEDCHVLPDVHSGMEDMGEVTYDLEQNLPFDVFLTKVEVTSISSCIYNFFKMQVISQRGRSLYILFTRSGRIGTEGQYQQHPYHSVDEATKEFCRLFKAKTGNNWADFKNFQPLPRKYRLVESTRRSRRRLKDIAIVTKSDVPSRLPDYLEDLMNSLTRLPMLQEACCDIGIDASIMPFGRLCEAALLRGRQILKELRNLATEKMKLLEDSQNRERIIEIAEKIVDFSSEYFQVVPQYGYSCEKVQPLENLQEIQTCLERLDDIFDLELVSKMLLGAQLRLKEISPLDYVYRALRCQICVLKEEEADAQYILQYIHNTALTRKPIVECIFRVSRETPTKPNAASVENKWLLWHSSAVSGVLSVLHCGVAIAPSAYVSKEYSESSHKIGKEIRFTDVFEMSQRLSRRQNDQSSNSQYAFLCEVSLGNMKECEEDGLASLQENHNSAKILGTYFPDPAFNLTLTTGITVPLGLLVCKYNNSGARILRLADYNQYLVTKSDQVNVRYLVRYRYEQFDRKMKTTKVPTHS